MKISGNTCVKTGSQTASLTITTPPENIDKESLTPLYRQIENQFRDAILAGIIKPGLQLPASRVLASELGVSRPTIVQVYEYLVLEGFLESKPGSGTFVSRILPGYIPQKITQPSGNGVLDCHER